MSRSRRPSRSRWRRPSAPQLRTVAFAGLATLLLGWLIARNAAEKLYDQDRPAAALNFWPPSGRALAAVALDQTVMANGNVGPQSRALLEQAIRRAPLLATPLILAGFDASARGETAVARRLMEEARRRDPRSVIARSWLLDYYLTQGDYAAGLGEIGPLMILQGEAQPALMTMTAALLQIAAARPALLTQLRSNPWWRVDFVEQASASPDLVPALASLLRQAPNRSNPAAAAQEWQALLQGVAAEGRYELAYQMWLSQLPAEYRARVASIYDGDFHGWPGVRPFAWRLHMVSDGSIQRVDTPDLPEKSALQISSNASRIEMVAEQLMMIAPGAYRLSFMSRSLPDAEPDGAGLGATVRCLRAGNVPGAQTYTLAGLTFSPTSTPAIQQLDFTVPRGCGSVLVGFLVRPGENPGPVNAQLTGVRLMPVASKPTPKPGLGRPQSNGLFE